MTNTDDSMAGSTPELGLCATCNHVRTCTSREDFVGPVTFCEEFDAFIEPKRAASAGEQSSTPESDSGAGAQNGLCVNCAHRENCGHRGVEGGIWHCEEYE
jgi:hypothetical protein